MIKEEWREVEKIKEKLKTTCFTFLKVILDAGWRIGVKELRAEAERTLKRLLQQSKLEIMADWAILVVLGM